jgi:hypothetical protein
MIKWNRMMMAIERASGLGETSIMETEMATTAPPPVWKTTSDEALGDLGLLGLDSDCQPPRPWSQVIDELLAIRRLTDDWDGQGAEASTPALVDGAITLAQNIRANGVRAADLAIAGVNGTVIFEWHDPAGYLELEVTAPNRAEGRWVAKGSDAARTFTLSRRV